MEGNGMGKISGGMDESRKMRIGDGETWRLEGGMPKRGNECIPSVKSI
jgi:hypothetical protein